VSQKQSGAPGEILRLVRHEIESGDRISTIQIALRLMVFGAFRPAMRIVETCGQQAPNTCSLISSGPGYSNKRRSSSAATPLISMMLLRHFSEYWHANKAVGMALVHKRWYSIETPSQAFYKPESSPQNENACGIQTKQNKTPA
jgi:hypothetical protein